MQRRFHPALYVILPLAIIGIADSFQRIVFSLVIPVAIIVVLFGVYMIFQRRSFRRPQVSRFVPRNERSQSHRSKTKRRHTVNATFRVIEGSKNRGDDEPPRYH